MLLQVPCCKHPSSHNCPSSGQSEPSMVISFFRFSKSSFISGVQFQRVSFFSRHLILLVCLDKLLINFDRCCIEPRKDLSSLTFFGAFSFVIASVLFLPRFDWCGSLAKLSLVWTIQFSSHSLRIHRFVTWWVLPELHVCVRRLFRWLCKYCRLTRPVF